MSTNDQDLIVKLMDVSGCIAEAKSWLHSLAEGYIEKRDVADRAMSHATQLYEAEEELEELIAELQAMQRRQGG